MKWIWKIVFSNYYCLYKKGEVHFFIREFWKYFSGFISDFIVVAESFYKEFLRSFSSTFFQSLGIEPSVILYIYYMVDSRKI